MAYVKKEDLEFARQMDLLTYKQSFDPYDLVKIKDGYYQLKSHDSLKINYHNGKWLWHWWSRGIGGRSALDYLMEVEGMSLVDAVGQILGRSAVQEPAVVHVPERTEKSVHIPDAGGDEKKIYSYLCDRRGIDREIVREFVESGNIYVTKDHGNIAFVGRNEAGNIKLVALRGMQGDFKNTTSGSDRRYPFSVHADRKNSVVHLFEAPIDLLSYATLMKQMGLDYKNHNMIALCGIYQAKKNTDEIKVPVALDAYLIGNKYTDTVCLHLDNDGPGKASAKALSSVLEKSGFKVYNQPPPQGYKDCNDYLVKGVPAGRNEREERQVRER